MRLFTVFAAFLLSALSCLAADISGAWALSVDTPNGKIESTVDMKQDGEKLTGTLHNQFGDAPISGTVKDTVIEFTQKLDMNGTAVTIGYSGKVDSAAGTMSGKFKFGDQGEGDWTATKAKQ